MRVGSTILVNVLAWLSGFALFRILVPGSTLQILMMVGAWYFYRRIWKGRIKTDIRKEQELVCAREGGAGFKERLRELGAVLGKSKDEAQVRHLRDRIDYLRRSAAALRKGKHVDSPARKWLLLPAVSSSLFIGLTFAIRPSVLSEVLHPRRGEAYAELHDRGELDLMIEQGAGLDTQDVGVIYNTGLAYLKRGNLDMAREHFLKALEMNPYYVDAHYNLGEIDHRSGDLESAEREFNKCLRIDGNLADARFSLGVVLLQQGKPEEAIIHLERAHNLYPVDSPWRARSVEMARRARARMR